MPIKKRGEIASILKHRIAHAVASGALKPGDRLPSTREAGADLGADPRVVAAAYRKLSDIGLVTLSSRSGAYVSKKVMVPAEGRAPSDSWLVEALAAGIAHGAPISALSMRIAEISDRKKQRVVVIALTVDQAVGIARELHRDYGFETSYILTDALQPDKPVPRSLKEAQVLVTTARDAELVETLAKRLNKISVVIKLRPDVIGSEWAMLMQHPVYVVGMDARMLDLIRAYTRDVPGAANVVMLVAGHDDLSRIPADAPTYVTEAARRFLGKTNIPGRLIKPSRLLDGASVLRMVEVLVAKEK